MTTQNKNTKTILIILVIFLLSIFMNFFMYNKIVNMGDKFDKYENTIKALNDTLTLKIDGQNAIWSKLTPEININDLVNSEYFKNLSTDQQIYYKELQKIKGLIASTKAELTKHGEILDELNVSKDATIYKDSIKFLRGHEIAFSEKDTSKNLQWKSSILIDSVIQFKFDYDYKLNIQTNFIRNKDKSIKVEYKIDDKDLIMNKNYSFIIPSVQRTKWELFIDKNKNWLYPVGAGILVGTGGYIGYKIAK